MNIAVPKFMEFINMKPNNNALKDVLFNSLSAIWEKPLIAFQRLHCLTGFKTKRENSKWKSQIKVFAKSVWRARCDVTHFNNNMKSHDRLVAFNESLAKFAKLMDDEVRERKTVPGLAPGPGLRPGPGPVIVKRPGPGPGPRPGLIPGPGPAAQKRQNAMTFTNSNRKRGKPHNKKK